MTQIQDSELATDTAARRRGSPAAAASRRAKAPQAAALFPARVVGTGPDLQSFLVAAEEGGEPGRARTADSCLLRPEPDDLVLCASYPSGGGTALYILSVLVRADVSRPATLSTAGGLTLSTADGPMVLNAGQSISILGGSAITMGAETLSVRADAGVFNLQSAVLESEDAVARIGTLRLLGEKLLSLVRVISGQHLRATRKVEEVDQVQAGEVMVSGERLIAHQAHQIVHVSTEDMRFDGARIHMG